MPFFLGEMNMTKDAKDTNKPLGSSKAKQARREQEQRQLLWLRRAAVGLGIFVFALIIAGIVYEYVYKPNKALARVEDEKISVSDFQEAVRYQRSNMINNYSYMAQLYSSLGITMDESTRSSYETQLSAEYAPIIGNEVLNSMVNQRVLDYGAKEAGYTVSEEEINQKMESLFGFYPNGTPTTAPTSEPFISTPTVSEAQLAILKYTPTPEATEASADLSSLENAGPDGAIPTVTINETAEATETAVPEDQATEPEVAVTNESDETAAQNEPEISDTQNAEATVVASVEPTDEAEPTPSLTPTVFTQDMYETQVSQQFPDNGYFSKAFFRKQIYYELLQAKVTEAITSDLTNEAEMVWARHILVETEEEAKSVIERYNAGEDWAALAAELSLDTANKDNGGDLGWFQRGSMVEPFEEAAFAQEIGSISQEPVSTTYGFHIIQIVGHEVRPLTSSEKDTAINTAFSDWLGAAREKLNVTIGNDWSNYVPTDPELSPYL